MKMIRTIVRELVGLFIDDGRLALSIVVWLAIVWLVLPAIGASAVVRGLALFLGLGSILVENAVRGARSGR
jgi:hypothetical protein